MITGLLFLMFWVQAAYCQGIRFDLEREPPGSITFISHGKKSDTLVHGTRDFLEKNIQRDLEPWVGQGKLYIAVSRPGPEEMLVVTAKYARPWMGRYIIEPVSVFITSKEQVPAKANELLNLILALPRTGPPSKKPLIVPSGRPMALNKAQPREGGRAFCFYIFNKKMDEPTKGPSVSKGGEISAL